MENNWKKALMKGYTFTYEAGTIDLLRFAKANKQVIDKIGRALFAEKQAHEAAADWRSEGKPTPNEELETKIALAKERMADIEAQENAEKELRELRERYRQFSEVDKAKQSEAIRSLTPEQIAAELKAMSEKEHAIKSRL